MRTTVHQLHRIRTLERRQRPPINVNPDVAQRRRLALHNRPAAQVCLDVHTVRRHQRNQRLAQPRRRFRPEISIPHGAYHSAAKL